MGSDKDELVLIGKQITEEEKQEQRKLLKLWEWSICRQHAYYTKDVTVDSTTTERDRSKSRGERASPPPPSSRDGTQADGTPHPGGGEGDDIDAQVAAALQAAAAVSSPGAHGASPRDSQKKEHHHKHREHKSRPKRQLDPAVAAALANAQDGEHVASTPRLSKSSGIDGDDHKGAPEDTTRLDPMAMGDEGEGSVDEMGVLIQERGIADEGTAGGEYGAAAYQNWQEGPEPGPKVGYLWKKAGGKKGESPRRSNWNRRWFKLEGSKLEYYESDTDSRPATWSGELSNCEVDRNSKVLSTGVSFDGKANRYTLEVHFTDRILRLGTVKSLGGVEGRTEALQGLKLWEKSICQHHAYYTGGKRSAGANPYFSSPPTLSGTYQSISPLEEEERQYKAAKSQSPPVPKLDFGGEAEDGQWRALGDPDDTEPAPGAVSARLMESSGLMF